MAKKLVDTNSDDKFALEADLDSKANKSNVTASSTYKLVTYNSDGTVTGGKLIQASDIPSLAASKITSGTIASARLPTATSTAKGAVMPIAKTTAMTQEVGVDSSGKLYTAPGGGSSSGVTKIIAGNNVSIAPTSGTGEVTINASGGGGGGSLTGHTVTIASDFNMRFSFGSSYSGILPVHFYKADGTTQVIDLQNYVSLRGTTYNDVILIQMGDWAHESTRSRSNNTDYTAPFAETCLLLIDENNYTYKLIPKCHYSNGPDFGSSDFQYMLAFSRMFLTSNVTLKSAYASQLCFLKGSKVSLADGSVKNCEDITYDDNLLIWNFDEGKYDSAKPIWIKRAETNGYYFHCKFESGITFDITGESETGWGHRGLNLTRNSFTYFPASVGDVFYTKNGPDRLVSCERLEKEVEFYNIITERHFNLFANDILTSCSLNNLYPIKDMKFVKDDRKLRKIEDYIGVDQRHFDALRLSEQNGDIKKLSQYVHNLKMKEI